MEDTFESNIANSAYFGINARTIEFDGENWDVIHLTLVLISNANTTTDQNIADSIAEIARSSKDQKKEALIPWESILNPVYQIKLFRNMILGKI